MKTYAEDMTLRDYFAAKAMATLAFYGGNSLLEPVSSVVHREEWSARAATRAYEIADAMLRERAR